MEQINSWLSVLSGAINLLRDIAVFVLIGMVILWPSFMIGQLRSANVQSVDAFGLKLDIANKVDQSKIQTSAAVAALDKVVASNPDIAPQLTPISNSLKASNADLTSANDTLAKAISQQQSAATAAAGAPAPNNGWVYLGTIKPDRSGWRSSQTTDLTWPVSPGATGTVTDDAYIRADGPSNARSKAALLGVAPAGARFRVDQIDASTPLIAGGWTVWGRLTIQP